MTLEAMAQAGCGLLEKLELLSTEQSDQMFAERMNRYAGDRAPLNRKMTFQSPIHSAERSVRIRRGLEPDAGALAAFAARTFAEAFGADNRAEDVRAHLASAYGITQQARELNDPSMTTLLVHGGGNLVAYAQVRIKSPPPCVSHERPIELYRFYLDRSAHGTGVAQQLMAAARAAAREFGGRHLWLSDLELNPRARSFYKKEGFADVGSTDFYVGSDRQTDRVLLASLQAAIHDPYRT
jgi:GNAT superfamily N-acetyltransferase